MIELQNIKLKMYEMLTAGADLQQILEYAEEYLENPTAITTARLEVLAYSMTADTDDEIWCNVIAGSSGRYDLYRKLKEAGAIDNPKKTPVLLIDNPHLMPRRWLSSFMQYRGENLGQVVVMEAVRKFRTEDEEIIQTLGEISAFYIASERNLRGNYESHVESILSDMISGKTIPEGIIREQMFRIPWKRNVRHRMLILIPEDKSEYNMYPVKQQFVKDMPYACGIISNNRIIILVTWEVGQNDPIKNRSFENALTKERLIAGVSGTFSNITEVYEYYTQAEEVLACAPYTVDSGRIRHFADFAPEVMMAKIMEHEDLSRYYHDTIKTILKYDEAYNTNYLRDLYVYLSSDRNIAQTADLLQIHRNTVKYRIGKLEDLFHLDLNNPDEVFSLKYSFRVFLFDCKNRAPHMGARLQSKP